MTARDDTRPDEQLQRDLVNLDSEEIIDHDFLAAEAGDRPMAAMELREHVAVRQKRGHRWAADLLFALTHTRYSAAHAQHIWDSILLHKERLTSRLGRNPGIAVAALDYLTNVAGDLERPTIIAEPKMSAVAEVATRDTMTGLYDHSTFQVRLRDELRRAGRAETHLSLIMLDVDHFKQFNDEHGHQAGDGVLRRVAAVLERETRDVDTAARYGGEEFAVIAPSTALGEAEAAAERVRRAVAADLSDVGVTISLGVASHTGRSKDASTLIRAADVALYWSKERGRNRVTVAPPDGHARHVD